MGVGGQRHVPAALPPPPRHSDPVPLYRTLGGPQGWSGQVRKIFATTGIRSVEYNGCTLRFVQLHVQCVDCIVYTLDV
jgi:hypothetical protein